MHGIATAAGCQLVAACDLAVAASDARFATPGVNIGLFCSTPMVPVVARDRAQARARDAAHRRSDRRRDRRRLGPREPGRAAGRARRRGHRARGAHLPVERQRCVALGKRAFYAQDGLTEADAYAVAAPVMSANAALDDAREGITAFLEKRPPVWPA